MRGSGVLVTRRQGLEMALEPPEAALAAGAFNALRRAYLA